MRTFYTCSLTRSLPFVLAALALACSSNDEPRPSASAENAGAIPNNTGGGSSADGKLPNEDTTLDDDASDTTDVDHDAQVADDAVSSGVSAGADSDNDGLADSVETNTKVFRDKNDTGTDPKSWDTDGDGISDGDEVLVTAGGLNLAKMGTNPLHQDILMEYDWFEDSSECAFHSHKPNSAVLNLVTAGFAASPVRNPDGTTGIKIIHDYGQGGAFTGGNRIATNDVVLDNGVGGDEFQNYRLKNFAENRRSYFHYVLMSHRYTYYDNASRSWIDTSSGQANLPGNDLIVSLACYHNNDFFVAATIVHELGHNLNLQHGGDNELNYKPNYNSVMNYKYQFDGVDTDCTPPGNKVIDYSRNQRIALDENALDERVGICKNTRWDWNGDKKFDARVSFDINGDQSFDVLTDYDDWAAIRLSWQPRSSVQKRDIAAPVIVNCDAHLPGM